jgi:hypothetical protein
MNTLSRGWSRKLVLPTFPGAVAAAMLLAASRNSTQRYYAVPCKAGSK